MASVTRRVRLAVPADAAFAACLRLLTDADPARGVVERRCIPMPPRNGSTIVSTVRDGRGERVLRARIVELDPPRAVATASEDDGPAVRTRLTVEEQGTGAVVTLSSEATTALGAAARATGMVDRMLLGRAQRRAAAATLRRLRDLSAEG